MTKPIDLNLLRSFLAVASARSFTRAAAQLGVTQSALSHAMRGLEAQLGVRLLSRSTRGVTLTEAGEHALRQLGPHVDGLAQELDALRALGRKPGGLIRLTAHDHAADTLLWPRLRGLLAAYPDITVEVNIHYGLVDIVAERFDAGVRSGDLVAQDMVSVRIGPDFRMAVVASPGYLQQHGTPQRPQDLSAHRCINLRLPTQGGLYAWEFDDGGTPVRTAVQGQVICNTTPRMVQAALDGLGLAYVPLDVAAPHLASGALVSVLAPYCPMVDGYRLYFASRRQMSPAFALVLDCLRQPGAAASV